VEIENIEIFQTSYAVVECTLGKNLLEVFLQGFAPSNNHAHADDAFNMQPMEIFQVAIIKRILIVPLDFQSNSPLAAFPNMIDFMSG